MTPRLISSKGIVTRVTYTSKSITDSLFPPPPIVSNVDLFCVPVLWSQFAVKSAECTSNDFNKVRDCFDGGMAARAEIYASASDFVEGENKKTWGGESFHRYHVGAAFLLVYFPF